MNLTVVGRSDLSTEQLERLEVRLQHQDHAHDGGPIGDWNNPGYALRLYAAVEDCGDVAAIFYVSDDRAAASVAWWLDSKHRNQGIGSKAVDALCKYMKMHGWSGVAPTIIQTFEGRYDTASRRLVDRLRSCLSAGSARSL